ncbi:MAG: NERD domain-containing protein [Clostridia bacterium]|nr:NERD domain-containing protein [Clostridia bacterium]
MPFIIIGLIVAAIVIAIVAGRRNNDGNGENNGQRRNSEKRTPTERKRPVATIRRRDRLTPEKIAGNRGEKLAEIYIKRALDGDDYVFKNVEIVYDGRETELDEVVVNCCGVFIIEVKNLRGIIDGGEDDAEWTQYKTADSGITYGNSVKNPVKQVNREVYLLKNYLLERGVKVWVEGYVFFVQGNCPVRGERVLESIDEIRETVHTPVQYAPGQKKADRVAEILAKCSR